LRQYSCANILAPKKLQSQTQNREKLLQALLHKKIARKMLMKFTRGSPEPTKKNGAYEGKN